MASVEESRQQVRIASVPEVLIGIALVAGLYLASVQSYLLFHSLAELFGIVVSFGVFILFWNSRRFLDNGYFLILGVSLLGAGVLGLVHTLAYEGMGVLSSEGGNRPAQLWITARGLEAVSLLAAPFALRRKLDAKVVLAFYAATVGLLLAAILYWDVFPHYFTEGVGLSPLKKASEYVICVVFGGALALLYHHRQYFDRDVFRLLAVAIVISIGAEFAFTLYSSAYSLPNFVGHILKIVAFWLVYKAVIQVGLNEPHDLLFRELRQSEERLRLAQQAGRVTTFAWEVDPDGRVGGAAVETAHAEPPDGSGGRHGTSGVRVHPEDLEGLQRLTEDAIDGKAEYHTEYRILEPDGGVRWVAARGEVQRDERGRPSRLIGVHLDLTEKKREEERTRRHASVMAGINRVFEETLTSRTEEQLARTCLSVAEEVTASAFGFVGEMGSDGLLYCTAISDPGWVACEMAGPRGAPSRAPLPVGFRARGILDRVLTEGVPVLTNDPGSHPDRGGLPAGHPPLAAFLGAPLLRGGQPVGMIGVANREGGYGEEELRSLEALAPAVAQAFEHKRAEMELERTRTLLSEGQRIAHLGSWEYIVGTQETVWSDEQFRIFGLEPGSRSPSLGELMEKHIHPDDAARVGEELSASIERGSIHSVEFRVVRPDGSVRVLYSQARPHFDAGGRILKYVGTALDITERREAEAALRESERRLRVFFESDMVGTIFWRVDGSITNANDKFLEMTGYDRGDLLSGRMQWTRMTPPEYQHLDERALADLEARGVVGAYEKEYLRKDGTRLPIILAAAVLDERRQEGVAFVLDITNRKQVELELEQAKELAESANRAKTQFLANMSHELRTPMNAILGLVEVALPRVVDPTVRDCLETMEESAGLLRTLLDDLLDSAKIESGRLELESAPFSLPRLLDQIKRVLSVRASEKGLSFSCNVPEDLPDAVVGDPVRLGRVLLNLAGNAIKFTEQGEVEIRVNTLSRRGDALLAFAVRDTGIGIPPSAQARLFRPFAQADASVTRRFGGTGLGLSIAKSLVDLMGGSMTVESEVGKGSTFYFTVRLPLADALPPELAGPVLPHGLAKRPLRVLVVEDNPANQKLATYVLRDRGHRVEVAGDGREAVALAARDRYDVILMDVQMPGIDGLQATAAIRRAEREKDEGRRVPIIAMTAHAMSGDEDRCLAAGMDHYLSKPVDIQEMMVAVESLAEGAVPPQRTPRVTPEREGDWERSGCPVFSPEEALERCFDSTEMVREMAECFLNDADDLLVRMRAAVDRGDLLEVGRLGHRMKGTVAYLGARPAREAALRVERFCKSTGGTPAEAEEAVAALDQECLRLRTALAELAVGMDEEESARNT